MSHALLGTGRSYSAGQLHVILRALLSPPRNTPPREVCGSSGSTSSVSVHTPSFITPQNTRCDGCSDVRAITPPFIIPKHTLWVFRRVITPPFITPLIYHTPKHTLWVLGRDITPPGLSRCTLSPGVHKIPHPPQDTTPGDNISEVQNPKLSC